MQHITFYLSDKGLPTWLVNAILTHTNNAEVELELIRIQTLAPIHIADPLKVMAAGLLPFELCQLRLQGNDSIQIYQILLPLLQQEHIVIDTKLPLLTKSHHDIDFVHFDLDKPLEKFHQLCQKSLQLQQRQGLEKTFILQNIAKLTAPSHQEALEKALSEREAISSTAMPSGIALPHVMTEYLQTPKIICCVSSRAIDWGAPFDPVTHIIGLVLPKNAEPKSLLMARHLCCALADKKFTDFLCQHTHPQELKAILFAWLEFHD